ncbi:hypothetical protein NBRC116583_34490 [Arenicella sp. 4NH20-0111]|uniref:winged helix-turn-helix domain-containing protein n=1 Tax=Arenicella sp. 4NH20-0111 TaxID=3127648 RepID=UPI003102E9A2
MSDQLIQPGFSIGEFDVDPDRHRIVLNSSAFQIEPLVMRVLCVLADEAGQVVSQDILIERVWGSEYGTSERLVRAISLLRKVFREVPNGGRYIETIPKRGYRLTRRIKYIAIDEEIDDASDDKGQVGRFRWLGFEAIVSKLGPIAVLIIVLVIFLYQIVGPNEDVDPVTVSIRSFTELTHDADIERFSSGLNMELHAALSGIAKLKVIDLDTPKQSSHQKADFVLQGTVEQTDKGLRVAVQCVDAGTGDRLWSSIIFKRNGLNNIARKDIAQEISRALQARLGVGIGVGRASAQDISDEAFEHYLDGVALWPERGNLSSRRKAVKAFRMSVSLAPDFADAWARYGIAMALSLPEVSGESRVTADSEAKQALDRAMSLDSSSAYAHIGVAAFSLRRELDTTKAKFHAKRALEIAPKLAEAHYVLGITLLAEGLLSAAHRSLDRAIFLDSKNVIPLNLKLMSLAGSGKVSEVKDLIFDCDRCNDPSYDYIVFLTSIQHGSPFYIEEAIQRYVDSAAAYVKAGYSNEDVSSEDELRDMVEIFVHKRGRQIGRRGWMNDATPTLMMASVLAHLGEFDEARNILLKLRDRSSFIESFDLTSLGGSIAFPSTFVDSEQYMEVWQTKGMRHLAKIRAANNRIEGLPVSLWKTDRR